MKVNDKTKRQKLIVNINPSELGIFEEASKIENRTRNNFIITHAMIRAKEILKEKEVKNGSIAE